MSRVTEGWVVVDVWDQCVLNTNWTKESDFGRAWSGAHRGYMDEFGGDERVWFSRGAYLYPSRTEADNARRRLRRLCIKNRWIYKGEKRFSLLYVEVVPPENPTYVSTLGHKPILDRFS